MMAGYVDHELVRILTALRTSHPDIEDLYRYGQCYNLFLLIRTLRPNAIPWYSWLEGHVYSQVGKYWYDIRGLHFNLPDPSSILNHNVQDKPHRWGSRDTRRLRHVTAVKISDM